MTDQTDDKIKTIMQLAMAEKWEEARFRVRELIQNAPLDPGIKVLQADIENISGNEKEALRQLKEILRAHPEYGPAHYSTGVLHARQGRWDQAKSFFIKSIGLFDPDQREMLSDAWLQLGVAHWEQRNPGEAIEAWYRALSFNPAQWKAREYLEEFTPDYSQPKMLGAPEYFRKFQEIQVQSYLVQHGKTEFDSLEEADMLFRKMTEAWNAIPEKWKLEDLAEIERTRYFRSVTLI
ncbi:MAG: tetratricopeptide repeat protein [Nitrospirae bacterium]|nr:tetratricopeptide repeat protein [Nitrospirota bacterium]MBI3594301.1 tetratricopeptide repeat protein [Nitrospirota bacterium]